MKIIFALAFGLPLVACADENPVDRVVDLLEQLKTRITKDGVYEQAMYDKYACWCEESTKKTSLEIIEVKDLLKTTGNTILKLKGSVATLVSEIKGLVQDIKENEKKQAEQTELRGKENAAFMAEKIELESAISALQKAIIVLKAATGSDSSAGAFLQASAWTETISDVVAKIGQASSHVQLSGKQMSFLGDLSSKGSYAPQSATIQGILSDMYSTFAKNLQTSTADEARAHHNYEDLMATYQKELITLQKTLVKKEQRKAEDELQLADASQTYADSEKRLKAEIELFDATKASCEEKTSAWSKRSALRTSELEGIAKAAEILTSEEAKKTFDKAIKPGNQGGKASFLQIASSSFSRTLAQKVFATLSARANQAHSFRLAALAAEIRIQAATTGMFDAVFKTIDNLILQLREEEQEDIKKVDECKEQYQDITSSKNDLEWKIENNDAKIQKHEQAISKKEAEKEQTIKDIEAAVKLLAEMKSTREEENGKYLEGKADDEKAIDLLQKAKMALEKYFKEHSFLQQGPEPEFKLSKKNNAKLQTKGVLDLIDMIVEDLTGELGEAKTAEEEAQADYEKMKKAVEDQKDKLETAEINLTGQIAQEQAAKSEEEDTKSANEKSLQDEKDTEANLKQTCDDAIKLQPERAKKRAIELDGLMQAKDFLGGMTSDALLQTHHASNATVVSRFKTLSFLQSRML
jgi:uncharacterized protein YjbJ (UPF0337 family)